MSYKLLFKSINLNYFKLRLLRELFNFYYSNTFFTFNTFIKLTMIFDYLKEYFFLIYRKTLV
jgi:hypothetical protein